MNKKGQVKQNYKRILAAILSTVLLFFAIFLFVGCNSDTPRFVLSIYFDDNDPNTNDTYDLTYRMNRKYYPQTTNHYISIIDSGFYNNTIVHDFQSSSNKMIAGAFSQEQDAKNNNFKSLPSTPISVWADESRTQAIQNVVYGETHNNGFSISNGGFSNEKGAIGSYSYIHGQEGLTTDANFTRSVYANASHRKREVRKVQYLNNTVTTMFYISTENTAVDNNFCVFAVLDDNTSKNRFNDLLNAIEKVKKELNDQAGNANNDNFTDLISNVTIHDAFTNRYYSPRVTIANSDTTVNGILLPKRVIQIKNIRMKNY